MTTKKRPACGRPTTSGPCERPRAKGRQRCVWHWLLAQPIEDQLHHAEHRRSQCTGEERTRVPSSEWPGGERWCAGCQAFVPLFYCMGSRCKPHASAASHGSRIQREYGITRSDYEDLLRFQGGVCYICRRRPGRKRLAVDHDHQTGAVRGLLCANNENGCNRGVVANLEAAVDGGVEAARRALGYLEDPPFARMKREPEPPPSSAQIAPDATERGFYS